MKLNRWQPLIDGLMEAVWLVDPISLQVVAANAATERMLRMPVTALLGRSVAELASTPEDLYFWEDVAAGRSQHINSETVMRRGDGGLITVERCVSLVKLGNESMFMASFIDHSAQLQAEQELETLIAELRATLESCADGILVVNRHGSIRGYNQRFAQQWGLPESLQTRRDDPAVFQWLLQAVQHPDDYQRRLQQLEQSPLLEATDTLYLRSGLVLERVSLPQFARGRAIGRVYAFRDITRRLQDEAQLQVAAKVLDASLDAIFITDQQGRIVTANPRFAALTGQSITSLQGTDPSRFLSHPDGKRFLHNLQLELAQHLLWEGEIQLQQAHGGTIPCLLSLVRMLDSQGMRSHDVGFLKDLTEAKAAKRRIEDLAYNDTLTGLPNRLLLAERVQMAIQSAERNQSQFAVLFLDLDRFKHINDSLGHLAGDAVLMDVAQRLQDCLRQQDTAARLGGDEFILVLNGVNEQGAENSARRIIDALSQPFHFADLTFSVTCSIGIALYPDDGRSMDDLIKNADSAMYHVKERGRADFRFYQRQMNLGLLTRMKLDHAMREGLREQRFHLHYQPQVDLNSATLLGVEALIRWHDPELGEVPPGQFIPIAEETGLIVAIGNWVLDSAAAQASQWRRDGYRFTTAVNVSAYQFQQADFVERVADTLQRHQLPGEALELELTETFLIRDATEALRKLDALSALKVRMAIDDFGTGYSSLSYLKRFPIHKLKIDRSFIHDVPGDEGAEGIVQAIINMAQALHLQVTAEGVETEAQRAFLSRAGCTQYQGYLFARPTAASDLAPMLPSPAQR
ncbi:sensor domain-containing protein [Leeia aquatica]|uniref:EAL domain-containing protein n=1 Tax=Leeia aquatica TaxID=2725557 RepID=A0A847S5U3_9NEIS|nr:EAL domain-containing protein [Leeia aquatica]NLR74457.1 EAL domain-containing protein [Leeia aquatica]